MWSRICRNRSGKVSPLNNLDEMVYKILGNLLSGVPLGYTHKLIGYHLGQTFNPLRDKIFYAISAGLLSIYKSFFTILFWSWLPASLKQSFISLATLILHPSKTCSFFPFSKSESKVKKTNSGYPPITFYIDWCGVSWIYCQFYSVLGNNNFNSKFGTQTHVASH